MDPEEEQQNQDQDQQPLSDQGLTKKVAKKGFQTLRGLGAAGEAAETAEAGAVAAGAEATAGGAAAATGATEGLAAAAAGAEATAAATGAATEGALTGTAIVSEFASMGWALAIVLIAFFVITFIIVITGGGAGINTGGGVPPTPTPGPGSDAPVYIYFKGGYAYIVGPNGCVKTCSFNKGDTVDMTVHVLINRDSFPGTLIKLKANVAIVSSYFSVTSTTGNPDKIAYPSLGLVIYKWRFGHLDSGDNNFTFTITGKVTASSGDTDVKLSMEGVTITTGEGTGSGDIYASQDHASTSDTCDGRYSKLSDVKNDVIRIPPFDNPILLSPNANYGDPVCTFKQDRLTQVIKDNLGKYGQNPNDNELVNFWADIQSCEGTPNSHNACSAKDARLNKCSDLGTWGLYQMSANQSAGSEWKKESPRGDVPWQRQVQNAIWYNYKEIDGNFVHWEAAYCLCSAERYKNKPFCAEIKRRNLDKTCSSCN